MLPMKYGKETGSSSFIRRRRQRTLDGQFIHVPKSNSGTPSIVESDEEEIIDTSKTFGPLTLRTAMSSEKSLFLALLAFRIANTFLIQTAFVPDEFWQSVEVAHNWAFGYGYLTWEWRVGLRSPLYPFVFAVLFRLLAFLGLDSRIAVVLLPRLVQGILAAVADFHLYKFSKRLSGQCVAQWSLFSQVVNWFTLYTATRTLGNSLEWVLTTVALAYYPWPSPPSVATPSSTGRLASTPEMDETDSTTAASEGSTSSDPAVSRKAQWKFVLVVAVSILLRPTAAVQWLPLCVYHLYSQRVALRKLVILYCFIGLFTLGMSALIEKHFYGRWTLSQINFLQFNLLSDVARFYGVHPWHWYVTQGWPLLLFTQLPVFMCACNSEWSSTTGRLIILVIGWTIYLYSYLAHKEFRFLFPLLPLALHLCGRQHARWSSHVIWHRTLIGFLLVTNMAAALYAGLVHQRGAVDVVMALGRRAESERRVHKELHLTGGVPDHELFSVVFLTPCHSTPYYSHIHHNVSLRFLTCEPDLSTNGPSPTYQDEADQFYAHPVSWLQHHFSRRSQRPTYFILFDKLAIPPEGGGPGNGVSELLGRWAYHHCRSFFHAHFPTHEQHGRRIMVYCAHNKVL